MPVDTGDDGAFAAMIDKSVMALNGPAQGGQNQMNPGSHCHGGHHELCSNRLMRESQKGRAALVL